MTHRKWRLAASSAVILGGFAGAQAWGLEIEVLSSHPELVSGNSALIQLTGVVDPPVVRVNGQSSQRTVGISTVQVNFRVNRADPTKQIGLVSSLQRGQNFIEICSGRDCAEVTLINHYPNETLFAGPQDAPFLCEFDAHGLRPGPDAITDPWRADCIAVPKVAYYYRNNDGAWMPFDARRERPTDISTGANGQPMIIRQETGVINRAGYVISIPHDPAMGPTPTPTDPGGSLWNGNLVYSFGPGARGDGHHMGRGKGNLNAGTQFVGDGNGSGSWYIDHGYAFAAASLNSFGTTTDAIVSAETAYKLKEHFIKQFGVPLFTVGNGTSGGSMQQNIIANAYPGIIDGTIPSLQYADGMTFFQPILDCELLANALQNSDWSREQLDAVSGKYWGFCISNGLRYPGRKADNCDTAVLAMIEEDPRVDPEDVRCTFADDLAQVFGIDPETGAARSPWDNVGVQYGLVALNAGIISFEQFIDLNQRIGGHDINGNITPDRAVGDPQAVAAAYATGQVNLYNGGNASIPIVSTRYNLDDDPWGRGDANVDVHDRYHSAITAARLMKYNGNRDNFVQFTATSIGAGYGPNPSTPGSPFNQQALEAVAMMDAWMTAIANDTSDMTQAEKVAAHKPDGFGDACWVIDGLVSQDWAEGNPRGTVEKVTDWNRCEEIFPIHSDARMAAGGPATADIFKCQLKPIDPADYSMSLSADQTAQLQATFPDGVCDWTQPGVGQEAALAEWAIFTDHGTWRTLN
jgi:hypothetical protein